MSKSAGLGALEAKLAALRREMEDGLGERAIAIRGVAARLRASDGPEVRAELRTHAHRLRGVAGTHGHAALGDLAARLEAACTDAPAPDLIALAGQLADATATERPAPARSIPPLASEPPRPASGKLRVLAVDDDPSMRRLVELTLRNIGGHDVVVASSAEAALAEIDRQPFDLVIVDAMMPGLNGMEMCRAVRGRAGLDRMPLVMLSAASPDELGWTLGDDGPSAWLRKPFRPDALLAEINRLAGVGADLE